MDSPPKHSRRPSPGGIPEEFTRYRIPEKDRLVGPDLRFPLRDLLLILVEIFLG